MAFADDDVKIYNGDEEASPKQVSEGEKAAAEFLYHKDNGNLEKTRQLGELLARTLVDDVVRLKDDECKNQKLVLISYLAVDELEAEVSNLILQKSILSFFNHTIELLNPGLFAIVSDSAAYTLYILNDRQGEHKSCGQILAELCGKDEDAQFVTGGNALEKEYRQLFKDIIRSYHFK